MEEIIALNKENIDNEHICCAFSDKKCQESYMLKKMWLKKQFKTRGLTGKQTQCLFDIKKSLSPSSPPIVRTNH